VKVDRMIDVYEASCVRYFRQGTLLHHYGEVLAIMMKLRQMCCHPMLVAKDSDKISQAIGQSVLVLCCVVAKDSDKISQAIGQSVLVLCCVGFIYCDVVNDFT